MTDTNKTGRIAIISFIDPLYGHAGGATKNVQNSCDALAEANYQVDLYSFHNTSENPNHLLLSNGVNISGQYRTSNNVFLFLRRYPFCVERRRAAQLMKIDWSKYDLVLFEGEQVYWIYKRIKGYIRRGLIRMHDIESTYRREVAASQTGIHKFLNNLESYKFTRIEKELCEDESFFGFVSTSELEMFKKNYKKKDSNLLYLPPFYDFVGGEQTVGKGNYIIFFGDLSLENNYLSIKWYLENCFKKARAIEKSLTIHVCGKTSDKQKLELEGISEGVISKGFVDDLPKEIANAKFVVCPILYGAGVKIKLFEALSYGKLVLANSKALEGTLFENGKHLIVVETAEEFITKTINFFRSPTLPNYSYNLKSIFERVYSSKHFIETIEKLIGE